MANSVGPIWIDPPKYWAATAGKSEEEITQMWEHLSELLAEGKIETIKRFEFVTCIGYPYRKFPSPGLDS
jgi:hypothetical protein